MFSLGCWGTMVGVYMVVVTVVVAAALVCGFVDELGLLLDLLLSPFGPWFCVFCAVSETCRCPRLVFGHTPLRKGSR